MSFNYPQYATAYPQYFDNRSIYNEKYYNQINENWNAFITRNISFEAGQTDTIVTSRGVSISNYIQIFGNLKITTYNSNKNSAFTICLYDKEKNFIAGIPLGYETLNQAVTHNVTYKDGYYMRIRSATSQFLNQTVKIERGWLNGNVNARG